MYISLTSYIRLCYYDCDEFYITFFIGRGGGGEHLNHDRDWRTYMSLILTHIIKFNAYSQSHEGFRSTPLQFVETELGGLKKTVFINWLAIIIYREELIRVTDTYHRGGGGVGCPTFSDKNKFKNKKYEEKKKWKKHA